MPEANKLSGQGQWACVSRAPLPIPLGALSNCRGLYQPAVSSAPSLRSSPPRAGGRK